MLNICNLRVSRVYLTKPTHFQWLMNAVRYRSRLSAQQRRALASGATRNEQLHHRLNSHFRQVLHISQRLLEGSVKTWLAADTAIPAELRFRALNEL